MFRSGGRVPPAHASETARSAIRSGPRPSRCSTTVGPMDRSDTGRSLLETQRPLLRPFESADAAEVQRLAGERAIADTNRNIPHPYADGLAEAWIESQEHGFAAGRLVNFAITLRAGRTLIGSIGLTLFRARDPAGGRAAGKHRPLRYRPRRPGPVLAASRSAGGFRPSDRPNTVAVRHDDCRRHAHPLSRRGTDGLDSARQLRRRHREPVPARSRRCCTAALSVCARLRSPACRQSEDSA